MVRPLSFAALLLALAGAAPALAQGVNTRGMACYDLQAYVMRQGATLLRYGPGQYQRVVSERGQCLLGERLESFHAPTADTPQCPVGYFCATSNTRNR